jgi:multicomponent Na+:H+ antiporter subunit E
MNPALTVLVLALIWAAITGTFSGLNLLLGAAIGSVAVLLLRKNLGAPHRLRQLRNIASLSALFLYELGASAVRVAIVVLTPDLDAALKPAIIAFPLTVTSDAEITLLANLITLTPGTLSVDVSEDRRLLYVHALNFGSRESLIADIAGGFEAKVREVYS